MKRIKRILRKLFTKKDTITLFIVILVIIIGILLVVFLPRLFNKSDDNEEIVVEKIDQMENYDYYLDDTSSDYYKDLYNDLKNVLNNDIVNDEEYAKVISKLFVADLFTLDNKITSSDVGGLQFVYTDFKEDFVNIAKNSLYSSVQSNIYGDRTQKLPIVSNVEINTIQESIFDYNGIEYNSYNVLVNINYETDLGYPTSYNLTLVKNDKYFQVVSGQ